MEQCNAINEAYGFPVYPSTAEQCSVKFDPYTPGTKVNSADLDKTPQNTASDQNIHCLLE